jgi:sulfonate transport system substrate-binding protein
MSAAHDAYAEKSCPGHDPSAMSSRHRCNALLAATTDDDAGHVDSGYRYSGRNVVKRKLLLLMALLVLCGLAMPGPALSQVKKDAKATAVRIGVQASSALTMILRSQGTLERALAPLGVEVRWSEFATGPALFQALNDGSVDLTADMADAVPVVGQAKGTRLTYVAQEAPSPKAAALVVRDGSPIAGIADLKGRRIAVTRATGLHYMTIVALQQSGLTFSDIVPVYVTPAEGKAALLAGKADAWATRDPYLAAAQRQSKVRILTDGRYLTDYARYYLAATPFVEARPDVVLRYFEELQKTGAWVRQNPAEAAALLAPLWKLDADTVALANSRRSYAVRLVRRDYFGEQQKIADHFFAEGLLPRRLATKDVSIWKPGD